MLTPKTVHHRSLWCTLGESANGDFPLSFQHILLLEHVFYYHWGSWCTSLWTNKWALSHCKFLEKGDFSPPLSKRLSSTQRQNALPKALYFLLSPYPSWRLAESVSSQGPADIWLCLHLCLWDGSRRALHMLPYVEHIICHQNNY